jgi:hypothetical protein
MEELIEKYAIQCTSWPYWRDMPNNTNAPSPFITEWPEHITEEQKTFWRSFVSNMLEDLKKDITLVDSNKLDQIIQLLSK